MLFRFNRLTLLANIVSLQFTEISEYQPSLSYRASKSRFFPYIHCKFCRVSPTTKMTFTTVKSSIHLSVRLLTIQPGVHVKAVLTSLNTEFLPISQSRFKQRFLGDFWAFWERDFFSRRIYRLNCWFSVSRHSK